MKYVCKICGYVYDEAKEAVPFAELPDSWVCPLCGASKSDFEEQDMVKATNTRRTVKAQFNSDMKKLSAGELSALCSNLARGCEKQYKQEESDLFKQLADYFAAVAPAEETSEIKELSRMLQTDLDSGYDDINSVAGENKDRGALRVCVWGEKVTRILNTLLQKYEKEGEAFLANTDIWVCTTCGFVCVGDNPPELCPVCKVPAWKFERVEGRG